MTEQKRKEEGRGGEGMEETGAREETEREAGTESKAVEVQVAC